MKKKDVKLGSVYYVKVSGKISPVRLDSVNVIAGGWFGKNLETGRLIRVRTAARLRKEVPSSPDGT